MVEAIMEKKEIDDLPVREVVSTDFRMPEIRIVVYQEKPEKTEYRCIGGWQVALNTEEDAYFGEHWTSPAELKRALIFLCENSAEWRKEFA
jgi:hypothetical protein